MLPARFGFTKVVLFVQIHVPCHAYQGFTHNDRVVRRLLLLRIFLIVECKTYR